MTAVPELPNISKFNVTADNSEFINPKCGALYIPPAENFSEISQVTLNKLISLNQTTPFEGIDKYMLEFCPEEIFLEKSFSSTEEATFYVNKFFKHFSIFPAEHQLNIIKRLERFACLIPSQKQLTLRFEVLSGDSCKKFHVDTVEARLIYTCAGPGTQIKLPSNNNFITLPSGSALIAKGSEFPNFQTSTLHRSPPIQDMNIKRFLFIADFS